MEAVRILEKSDRVDWDYDEEADVLYLSFGKPRKAVGIDIGDGVVLRYDEKAKELVGLTVLGMRARLLESLHGTKPATPLPRRARRRKGSSPSPRP